MVYIHPLAVEHHRKRWERHDAYRFAAPGTPEADPGFLHPWAAVARAEEAKAAAERDAFEREAFQQKLLDLRRQLNELKLEIAAKRAIERKEAEELRRKSDLAFENFLRVFKRYAQQQKYSPDQPRVPAGNPDGGQWTDGGGSGAGRDDPAVLSDATADNVFEPGTRLAANDGRARYPIDLQEEEARGGHAISAHVNRSPEALKAQVQEIFDQDPRAHDVRSGSFSSLAAATKLVNSTLSQNQDIVDQVASGTQPVAAVFGRFSSVTGIEAVAQNIRSQPYFRETYNVGAVIVHDRSSPNGYFVLTAFPSNPR
jgi:hypothetical protein